METQNLLSLARERFVIVVDNPSGSLLVDGIVHATAPIGLHTRDGYRVDVTHIPSGKRIYGFTTLGAALEFVQRVATLCDWTPIAPEVPPIVGEIAQQVEASAEKPRSFP